MFHPSATIKQNLIAIYIRMLRLPTAFKCLHDNQCKAHALIQRTHVHTQMCMCTYARPEEHI